jgi:hypothetical protein
MVRKHAVNVKNSFPFDAHEYTVLVFESVFSADAQHRQHARNSNGGKKSLAVRFPTAETLGRSVRSARARRPSARLRTAGEETASNFAKSTRPR